LFISPVILASHGVDVISEGASKFEFKFSATIKSQVKKPTGFQLGISFVVQASALPLRTSNVKAD
jgi:hypothetical protein